MEQRAVKRVDWAELASAATGAKMIAEHFPKLFKPIAEMIGAATLRYAKEKSPYTWDFRTVAPDSDDEDQLQRVFEVLQSNGQDAEMLKKAIADAWESMIQTSGKGA